MGCPSTPRTSSIQPIPGRISAPPLGRRRSTAPPADSKGSATETALRRSRVSARPKRLTKRPIYSKNSCVPASEPTMSTIARGSALKRHAMHMLQFKPGTDVAMLNGILNTIVTEGLYDRQYVEAQTANFKAFAEHIKDFTPEEMAPVCGIPADTLRTVARTYARAKSAIIFWGMGISQHVHGTDNARCLIALALICG